MTALAAIKDGPTRAFLDHARQSAGGAWKVRQIHDAEHGWRVEWTVGDKWLRMQPIAARKLARALNRDYRDAFHRMPQAQRDPDQERGMLAWLRTFDEHARDCLHKNRSGAEPERQADLSAGQSG